MTTLPPITTSHSGNVMDALIAELVADAGMQSLLTAPYVYAGTAPRGAAKQYLLWAGASERPRAAFGAGGTEGTEMLTIIANGPGDREARRVYARIVAVLAFPYPALAAPDVLSSLRSELVQCFNEPEDPNGLTVRGIVRLSWRAYATPT